MRGDVRLRETLLPGDLAATGLLLLDRLRLLDLRQCNSGSVTITQNPHTANGYEYVLRP